MKSVVSAIFLSFFAVLCADAATHAVPGALDLTRVALTLTDAADLSCGATYPLVSASGGVTGLARSEKLAYLPARQTANGVAAPVREAAERVPTVDVLVAYDATAKAYVDSQNVSMEAFARSQIDQMNFVLANNNLTNAFTYRLAGVCTIDASFTTGSVLLGTVTDNNSRADGPQVRARIRAMREKFGADTVTLLYDKGGMGGVIGDSIWMTNPGDVASCHDCGYNACNIRSVHTGGEYTMLHETAHNMGCGHSDTQAEQPWTSAYYDYSRGYHFTDKGGTRRHTVMAYNQDASYNWHSAIPYFSTSDASITYAPDDKTEPCALGDATHDNARVLRTTGPGVADWRETVVPYADDVAVTDAATGEEVLTGRAFAQSLTLALSTSGEGLQIRYTLDGTAPTSDSTLYAGPIAVDGTTMLKAAAFGASGASPVRTVKLYRLDALAGASGAAWYTSVRFPWTADGETIRSCNHTTYTTYCSSPLRAKVTGPQRLSFRQKTYFLPERLESSRFSSVDVFVDDECKIDLRDYNVAWSDLVEIDIPAGEHEVTIAYTQRGAMNNPGDYKDGTPETDDAVWLKDIALEDVDETVLNIPAGTTYRLADVGSSVMTIVGGGTLLCGTTLPDAKYGFTNDTWKGTVAFEGFNYEAATKDIRLELYGNAQSKVQLTNCQMKYLKNNNATFAGTLALVRDSGGHVAFKTDDGYSSNFNVFGSLEGDGAIEFAGDPAQGYVFNVATNFVGSIAVDNGSNSSGRRIVFGKASKLADLPSQNATITVQSGATASIGANARWYAYHGVEIAGTLLVKGAGAKLDSNASGAMGLKLTDGATLCFETANASLAFDKVPLFASGIVKVAFADGVTPTDGATLIDWSSKATAPAGVFAFASVTNATRWVLEKSSSGLVVRRGSVAVPGASAGIQPGDALADWLIESGFTGADGTSWCDFVGRKGANGYDNWKNFILGYSPNDAGLKFEARIEIRDGKVVVATTEGDFPSGYNVAKRLFKKEKLDDPWPAEGEEMDGKSETVGDAAASGFYKVDVDLRKD